MNQISRRLALQTISTGFGSLAFTAMASCQSLAENPLASKPTHFPARAKRVILLFMNGAPSHVDTFDYKPKLVSANGSLGDGTARMMPPIAKFQQRGNSGLWISDLFPNISRHADDLCLLRSMYSDQSNHPTAERAAHTGSAQFIRPSLGAWSV